MCESVQTKQVVPIDLLSLSTVTFPYAHPTQGWSQSNSSINDLIEISFFTEIYVIMIRKIEEIAYSITHCKVCIRNHKGMLERAAYPIPAVMKEAMWKNSADWSGWSKLLKKLGYAKPSLYTVIQ